MSGDLALAGLTSALQVILGPAAAVVPGAHITTQRPDRLDALNLKRGLNLYLYAITPNPQLRSDDLPTRRADGSFRTRPTLAVNAHYVLSAYGDDGTLEPQRLMGGALTHLHAHPILRPDQIRRALDAAGPPVDGSELDQQRPLIQVEMDTMEAEALTRMWQIFYQVPYQLSVTLRCTALRLPAQVEVTEIAPPKAVAVDPSRLPGQGS